MRQRGRPEGGDDGGAGEIDDLQPVDVHMSDSTPDFKGVDTLVDKVPEQLSPSCLLLIGCIPGASPADHVVPPIRTGRVQQLFKRIPCRTLMPKPAMEGLSRCGRDSLIELQAHT